MPSNIISLGQRFFTWWFRELVGLAPARWQQRDQARIEARQDGESIGLVIIKPPKVLDGARLHRGHVTPADFLSKNAGIRRKGLSVWLFPADGSILSRRVQIPASAASRFENLLSLEIDRWSPYKLEEIYVTWEELKSEHAARRDVDLRVIPRTLVEGLRQELVTAGIGPSFLALGPARQHVIDLRPRVGQRTKAVSISVSIILFITALAADWFVARRDRELWRERLRTEMQTFASQRKLEERISRAIASVEQADGSSSRGKILADVSAALPETDWLTEIVLKNESLTLRGYASNIDQLIKALEPLATDRTINLQGEVALDSGVNRQRFSLAFRPHGA